MAGFWPCDWWKYRWFRALIIVILKIEFHIIFYHTRTFHNYLQILNSSLWDFRHLVLLLSQLYHSLIKLLSKFEYDIYIVDSSSHLLSLLALPFFIYSFIFNSALWILSKKYMFIKSLKSLFFRYQCLLMYAWFRCVCCLHIHLMVG